MLFSMVSGYAKLSQSSAGCSFIFSVHTLKNGFDLFDLILYRKVKTHMPNSSMCRKPILNNKLTAMHCLMMQDCFMRPGPPNFFMSLQKWHSPHSVRRHASHFRQRVLLLLAPDVPRLADSLTADAGEAAILGFGLLGGRG